MRVVEHFRFQDQGYSIFPPLCALRIELRTYPLRRTRSAKETRASAGGSRQSYAALRQTSSRSLPKIRAQFPIVSTFARAAPRSDPRDPRFDFELNSGERIRPLSRSKSRCGGVKWRKFASEKS